MLVCVAQSAGGHGYSKYNGLSGTLQDFAIMCTWEGDNTVMALQTARYTHIHLTPSLLEPNGWRSIGSFRSPLSAALPGS